MPLNASLLETAIKGKLPTPPTDPPPSTPDRDALIKAVAEAVIEHITQNMLITIPPATVIVSGTPATQSNVGPIVLPPGSIT